MKREKKQKSRKKSPTAGNQNQTGPYSHLQSCWGYSEQKQLKLKTHLPFNKQKQANDSLCCLQTNCYLFHPHVIFIFQKSRPESSTPNDFFSIHNCICTMNKTHCELIHSFVLNLVSWLIENVLINQLLFVIYFLICWILVRCTHPPPIQEQIYTRKRLDTTIYPIFFLHQYSRQLIISCLLVKQFYLHHPRQSEIPHSSWCETT